MMTSMRWGASLRARRLDVRASGVQGTPMNREQAARPTNPINKAAG